jgi:tellurite resistance protein
MPLFLPLIINLAVPILGTIFSIIIPMATTILGFTLSRIPKIPSYIKLLTILWKDSSLNAQGRRYLNACLLLLASILSFMAYSLVPGTAMPIISVVTVPIASMLSMVVALTSLDFIFNLNGEYFQKKSQAEAHYAKVEDLFNDINGLHKILGNSWNKVQNSIKDFSEKLQEERDNNPQSFSNFEKTVDYQVQGLTLFLDKQSLPEKKQVDSNKLRQIVTDSFDSWIKDIANVSAGLGIGSLAGVGAASAASSVFVQAGIWTGIQSFFGLSTGGIVVSATTYGLLTVAAPIGIGALATVGILSGLATLKNKEESAKMSAFLGDILICSLPMAWADGHFDKQEKDTLQRLIVCSGMQDKDKNRVLESMEKRATFDEVFKTTLLFDEAHRREYCEQSPKEQLKHRLLLKTAWELAISDGVIAPEEVQLHKDMTNVLGIPLENAEELRRIMNLSSGVVLYEMVDSFPYRKKRDIRNRYLAPGCKLS